MADTLNVYREGNGNLTPPSAGGGGRVFLTIIGLCLALGALSWWYLNREDHKPVPPPPPDAGTPAPPKPTLPSPSESDPRVRNLLGGASTEEKWAEYLKQNDLVRVFVAATNNISEGESPRTRLFFLAPEGKFETVEKTDRRKKTKKTFAAPASFARYDGVAKVIGSLDENVIATAYTQLKPWIELAYEEIGPRNTKFDSVWQGAVTRLVNAPVPAGEVELVAKGLMFAYADPALEGLSQAEKHLLRMGPTNQKIVQEKLKAISDAIAAGAGADAGTALGDGGTAASMGDAGMAGTMGGEVTGDAGTVGMPSGTGTGTTGMMTGAVTDADAGAATTGAGTMGADAGTP